MTEHGPTTYGLWVRDSPGWLRNDTGQIMEFVSESAAIAQAQISDYRGQGDVRVCAFGPGGKPLPLE